MSLRGEQAAFEAEVEQQAAAYIRDGIAAPFDAIALARETVLRRRREAAGVESGLSAAITGLFAHRDQPFAFLKNFSSWFRMVKVGDTVMVPCVVKAIHLTEDYCNVDLETKLPMRPGQDRQRLTLNSRQTIKPTATHTFSGV